MLTSWYDADLTGRTDIAVQVSVDTSTQTLGLSTHFHRQTYLMRCQLLAELESMQVIK